MDFRSSLIPDYFPLLAGIGLSGLSILLSVLLVACPTWNTRRARKVAFGFLLTAFAILSIDLLRTLGSRSFGPYWFSASVILFVFLVCGFVGFQNKAIRLDSSINKDVALWSVIFLSLFVMAVCSTRLQGLEYEYVYKVPVTPGNVESDHTTFGVTDKGNRISLYHFQVTGDVAEFQNIIESSYEPFRKSLIKRDDLNLDSNCHGWVFAAGKFFVQSCDVDRILQDNGYQITNRPQVNDIVIYRTAKGEVNHTALVCAVLSDGTILLESKWGIDQRFIHTPDNQPYSKSFDFYRTNRDNHTIRIYEEESDL